MRSAVVFPQPDGPDEDEELAVVNLEVEVVDGQNVSRPDSAS